jgi:hypothetical protein
VEYQNELVIGGSTITVGRPEARARETKLKTWSIGGRRMEPSVFTPEKAIDPAEDESPTAPTTPTALL